MAHCKIFCWSDGDPMGPPDRFLRGVVASDPKSWFGKLVEVRAAKERFAVVFCDGSGFYTIAQGGTESDLKRIALSVGITYLSQTEGSA